MKIKSYWIPGLIVIAFISRLIMLHHEDFVPPPNVQQEDALLFDLLYQSKLLLTDDNSALTLPSEDYELIKKASRAQYPDLPGLSQDEQNRCQWIKSLYHSMPGHYIRNQIKQWNQTRQLAGIRDNRSNPAGHRTNQWQIINQAGKWQTIPKMSERFGFINHGNLRSGFNNWLTVHAYDHKEILCFQTQIHLTQKQTIMVHLIGKEPISIKPTTKKPIPIYPPNKKKSDTAQAFEIPFTLPKGKHTITIKTQAVQNPHISEPGMHIQRNPHTLAFYWTPLTRKHVVKTNSPLTIFTADGVALTDSQGNPNAFARENGLIPLIGIGKQTPFALYGLLSRSQVPLKTNKVVLSIQSRMQHIAQKTLQDHVNQMDKRDMKDKKTQAYCKARRASVVILNAQTGAILAIANYPTPPKNINPWDLVTFDQFFSQNNPMTLSAWQGINKHNAPGSSFKPVVVMAALNMHYYRNADNLLQELNDMSPLFDQSKAMLNFYKPYVTPSPYDYWNTRILPYLGKPGYLLLNMTQAITKSKNEWHKQVAMFMDGEQAYAYDLAVYNDNQPIEVPKFNICLMAEKLGFGKIIDLAPYLDQRIRLMPDPNKHIEGDILFAKTGTLTLSKHGGIKMLQLALSAIGHSMSSTPLQMARIAASIATQKIVTPDLLSQNNHGLFVPSPEHQQLDLDGLDILQNAMKQVVQNNENVRKEVSSYKGFTRIHGKTGTASMTEEDSTQKNIKDNTTWFIGWQTPEPNTNDQTLAFACMMTHVINKDKRTGAKVSAPIIRDILKQLDKLEPNMAINRDYVK